MKKSIKTISILICSIIFMNGCSSKNRNQSVTTPSATIATNSQAASTTQAELPKLSEYYPFEKNVKYIYEGSGNEYASYNLYNDYFNENKIQQRTNNGGTEAVRVIELNAGKLTRTFLRGEVYYRENFLDKSEGEPEILLMEPIIVGNSWKIKDSQKRTITNTAAEVETPMGNYKAIEVTTETPDGKNIDYYAKNIGLVKTIFITGDFKVISVLKSIEKEVPLVSSVKLYYPVKDNDKLHYISKDIAFFTNDITKQKLAQAYKEVAENILGRPLTTSVAVNSLYLNNDRKVYVDMNSAFIEEINKNKAYERGILQSIANTLGNYYNAQEVVLTIEGKLYKSDNITMKKGEAIKVNDEGSIKD